MLPLRGPNCQCTCLQVPTDYTHKFSVTTMSAVRTNYRHIARAGQQGAPSPVLSQAGVVNNATGCDNSSLSSRMLPETTSSDLRFPKNNLIKYEKISISTLNIRTLSCDIKLANAIQEAKNLGIDVLALQEVRLSLIHI